MIIIFLTMKRNWIYKNNRNEKRQKHKQKTERKREREMKKAELKEKKKAKRDFSTCMAWVVHEREKEKRAREIFKESNRIIKL